MVAKYEGQLRNHTIPEFEEKHIDEIRNSDLVAFSQKLLRKPGKGNKALSPRTAADIVARIRSIRKFSLLHDYEVNYASDCTEIPQRAEKIRVLSSEEEKKLVTYLKENFNLTALGVLLSLFTGIRLDELCALKWSDFSLKEHEFHVNKTMQKLPNPDQAALKKTVIEIGEPKSPCSVRTIPISEKFMNYIRSSYADGAYVLSGHKYYFIEPRTMENRFKAILRKCGIQDTKFHALRHTFATRYVELGFDVKTLNCLATFLFQNFLLNPVLFNN